MSTKKRRGGYLATTEGVQKLKEAKRIKKYTYQQIADAVNETQDKVKRLFNPQWGNGQYKIGEEAVQRICNILDLKPEEIVSNWYPPEIVPVEDKLITSTQVKKHDPSYYEALKKIEQAARDEVEELDLSGMELTELPSELKKLTKLKTLILGKFDQEKFEYIGNSLSSLPPEIIRLENLTVLDLSGNSLSSLPPEIGKLENLRGLYLSGNSLNSLPPEIGKLENLTELYLSGNSLSSLPPEIGKLENLTVLVLSGNSLSRLPPEIGKLANLTRFDLDSDYLKIPTEIIEKWYEPATIIKYYLSQQEPLHEAKMLLVGQENVGKTCLKERLIRNKYDPTRNKNKTDGIDIETWKIEIDSKQLTVNIWDFGGQEIMHSTHQFFITKRGLYLLVIDATGGEEANRIEYWLKIIESFGKDAPVIIVANKADQHPLDIDQTGLKKKYPQIKDFFEVSCKEGTGILELAQIVKQEINQLEHIDDLLPLPWSNVKKRLENMDKEYIPYEQYESLCEEEGVEEEDQQLTLIDLLNDLGIVLNFQDDPRLEGTYVLNPEWVTNGVYQILNDRDLIVEHRGILTLPTLERILYQLNKSRYPARKHLFIIGMMRKFELCFDIEIDKKFLLPDILPKEEPYTGEWDNTLAFEYHYRVLPSSIMSRFIVRMNHYIHQKTYWRSGVVLIQEGNLALVKADREDKIIKIRVRGKDNTRRNLLTAIRSQFDYMHQTIPRIVPVEKVPLIEHPEILLDYRDLLDLELMGETYVPIAKLKQRIPLRQLLDGIEER